MSDDDYDCVSIVTHDDVVVYTVSGPNRKNQAKLLLLRKRKEMHNDYEVACEVRSSYYFYEQRMIEEYVITCTPTEQGRLRFEAERAQERAKHPEWFEDYEYDPHAWRHQKNVRPKPRKIRSRASAGKPELDELERLELALCTPRCRKQRGWGRVYRPTRHRRYARDERNWKRSRMTHWRE